MSMSINLQMMAFASSQQAGRFHVSDTSTYLALPRLLKVLGHLGHVNFPFAIGKGTTGVKVWPESGNWDDGVEEDDVEDASVLGIDPTTLWRGPAVERSDTVVSLPDSSSNEELGSPEGEKRLRTALPSVGVYWLASETEMAQSRAKSGLSSCSTAASPQVTSSDEDLETSVSECGFNTLRL